jgi:hypothetical protein
MDELCRELSACLDEEEAAASGAETVVAAPPAARPRRRRRPPAARPSVWPLVLLLAGLAVLAAVLAAVFAFTDSGGTLSSLAHKVGGGGTVKAVRLTGATSYDPEGDNQVEHPEAVGRAADGNAGTYWMTETYRGGLQKSGVGLVLAAGSPKKLRTLVVTTDTPGFTAQIQTGASSSGPFRPASSSQTVGRRTTFSLHGRAARYYVVWITDLGTNSVVHVNEVTARGS